MGSDNIVVFKVDPETGALEPTGQTVEVPAACCVKFVPIPKCTRPRNEFRGGRFDGPLEPTK